MEAGTTEVGEFTQPNRFKPERVIRGLSEPSSRGPLFISLGDGSAKRRKSLANRERIVPRCGDNRNRHATAQSDPQPGSWKSRICISTERFPIHSFSFG